MVQFLDVEIIQVGHPDTNDLNVVSLQLSEQEVKVGLNLTHLILSILSISLTIHVMHGWIQGLLIVRSTELLVDLRVLPDDDDVLVLLNRMRGSTPLNLMKGMQLIERSWDFAHLPDVTNTKLRQVSVHTHPHQLRDLADSLQREHMFQRNILHLGLEGLASPPHMGIKEHVDVLG